MSRSAAALAARVLAGDSRAIARAISIIEDEDPAGAELVRAIFSRTGRAYLVGLTGPPGAGKSTLVDRLTAEIRRAGHRVGIIAVDPTSPFTGGAVLGDRLRMQAHAADDGVFIRSMATRGHLGGLSRATGDGALVLDAAGCDVVIIETVGVGQDEVDIVRTADLSIVALVPGAGDHVQALKAGIMEIADIFVVNKADRDDADHLVAAIEANLSLHTYGPGEWQPPVLKTVATTGAGVAELLATVWRFRRHSEESMPAGGPSANILLARRRERSEFRLRELVAQRFMDRLEREVLSTGELRALADRIAARELDPYTAASDILSRAMPADSGRAAQPPQSPSHPITQSSNS
jgi:LAO/AO transport system kinase